MSKPTSSKLVFPSKLSEVPAAQQAVVDAAKEAGFDEKALFAVRLALDEALTNAVRHGNASDPSKQVTLEFTTEPNQLTIVIEDEGPGFNPDDVPDPTAVENLGRPHGRGVMLMRAYMTDVQFNKRGNRVTLVKQLDCKLPHKG
ncbi:ATP-binding protein [Algisphaera agarilytica]|uniref:Serine/threonine-protein kinase RsbW n=1 Tax=Algisphaera agarilytica TaxID=1385975 RepID=A0A7X0H7V9_9BACT|nr:ATP-binding protein [Algisphaera agarilytica]MBB6430910.1 serine/threonine-protein kinase RsbW [Algisphaera agarilytica]